MAALKHDHLERMRLHLQGRLPAGLTAHLDLPRNYGRSVSFAVFHGDDLMGAYDFGWLGREERCRGYMGPLPSFEAMDGIAMIFTGWQPPADERKED
jgi:hypothetical protein